MSLETTTHGAPADHRSLAHDLVPILREACGGRLGEISWFKADWQRGGAATGTAEYRRDDGTTTPVVLKVPVVRRELLWMTRLQDESDPDLVVPRVFASGEVIGGYDLTWIVMEKFEHGPLGLRWGSDHVRRVAEAAARFHGAAAAFEVDKPPRIEPWDEMLADAAHRVRLNKLPEERRWTAAIKALGARLDSIVEEWRARDVNHWLHGDLHFANAMSRTGLDEGSVSLIDLAEVHAGHWLEDAVYLERQLWARPERMKEHKPVRAVAAARRKLGLEVEEDYPRLAMVRRALLAGTAPHFIKSEGHPLHLQACLNWVETAMAELK